MQTRVEPEPSKPQFFRDFARRKKRLDFGIATRNTTQQEKTRGLSPVFFESNFGRMTVELGFDLIGLNILEVAGVAKGIVKRGRAKIVLDFERRSLE